MLLTLKNNRVVKASLIIGISLFSSFIATATLAGEGPCKSYTDYDPFPETLATINPFPRNELPSHSDVGGFYQGLVATWYQNSKVNLRQNPNTNSKVLITIPDKSSIPLYGGFYSTDKYWWWFTQYQGKKGWIRADYVCNDS